MERPSIKCSHCGSNDFTVNVNAVPRGIDLTCNECGHVTYIAFLDKDGNTYGVNTPEEYALYEETYCRELSGKEVKEKLSSINSK